MVHPQGLGQCTCDYFGSGECDWDSTLWGYARFTGRWDLRHDPDTRSNHFLIIGPWDHPGARTPKKDVAGLTFGDASLLDMNDLHRQWYDWTLKNGPRPEFLKKRVAYYVVGPGAEKLEVR